MTNKTAWTPGPWKACRGHENYEGPYWDIEPDEQAEYEAKPFTSIKAANGDTVANAHDLFEFEAANAHLIALAPEMAELLRDLHNAVTYDGGPVIHVKGDLPVRVANILSRLPVAK